MDEEDLLSDNRVEDVKELESSVAENRSELVLPPISCVCGVSIGRWEDNLFNEVGVDTALAFGGAL